MDAEDRPAPEARLHAVAAFDVQRGVVRIYGGVGADDVPRTDTWEWNGTAWSRVSTVGPADRGSNHMAYDAGRQRTMALLFRRTAPNADQTYPTDLWEWTGTAWSAVVGAGPTFSPIQPMVGLGSGGGLLLFDGGVLQGTASTWIWQNVQWSRVSTAGRRCGTATRWRTTPRATASCYSADFARARTFRIRGSGMARPGARSRHGDPIRAWSRR
jgi:hypothetical protein